MSFIHKEPGSLVIDGDNSGNIETYADALLFGQLAMEAEHKAPAKDCGGRRFSCSRKVAVYYLHNSTLNFTFSYVSLIMANKNWT